MKTQQKQQVKQPKKREPRTVIVSFRLRDTEAQRLEQDLRNRPVVGIKSLKQFARKLTIDYAYDRLVYVRNVDRRLDPDSRKGVKIDPPNCRLDDARFVKTLRDFFNQEQNWHKLRLFMLQAGWPQNLVKAYRSTTNRQERLRIAQKVLTNMLTDN
jgi:hypothetical protein